MGFTKKKLFSKIIGVVDLWTHKIKVWIYSISWESSTLLWYWEKRQDSEYSYLGEFLDIEWVCVNIIDAITKAEKKANKKIKEVIFNFPFEEVFFCYKKINHNRKNNDILISKKESINIFEKINNISIESSIKTISSKSSYIKGDLKQIIHNVSNVKIDNNIKTDIVNNIWKNISFSILNIFIPISKYNLLHYMWNIINKKILKIIPIEYSLMRLFDDFKDLVIIDIWNSHISIIIKKSCDLIGVSKIPLWINDLVKQIQKNKNITKIDIINSIDDNIYLEDKKQFLWVLEDCLVTGLKEIIWVQICPHDFFITGWWWNKFIENYLWNIDLNQKDLKILWKINIINHKWKNIIPGNQKITTNILSLANVAPLLI